METHLVLQTPVDKTNEQTNHQLTCPNCLNYYFTLSETRITIALPGQSIIKQFPRAHNTDTKLWRQAWLKTQCKRMTRPVCNIAVHTRGRH